MINYKTRRLICYSDMEVVNGKLMEKAREFSLDFFRAPNLLSVDEKRMPYEVTFCDTENPERLICSICYFKKRDRYELTWTTTEDYQQKGYMTEALKSWIDWMFTNTEETQLWALISSTNLPSIKTALKCGFTLYDCISNVSAWYLCDKQRFPHLMMDNGE